MDKKKIRIGFMGLSARNEFNDEDNAIIDILQKKYDIEVCDNPDYLFCIELY